MTRIIGSPEGPAVSGGLIAETLGVPPGELDAFSVDPAQVAGFLDDPAALMLRKLGAIPTRDDIPHATIVEKGGVEVRTHVQALPGGHQGEEILVERTVATDVATDRDAWEGFGIKRVVRSFFDLNGDFTVGNPEAPVPLSPTDGDYLREQVHRWNSSHPV